MGFHKAHKRATEGTPFQLVYGLETIIPIKFVHDFGTQVGWRGIGRRKIKLTTLLGGKVSTSFMDFSHIEKEAKSMAWSPYSLSNFPSDNKVLLYDSKFHTKLGNLIMYWLGNLKMKTHKKQKNIKRKQVQQLSL